MSTRQGGEICFHVYSSVGINADLLARPRTCCNWRMRRAAPLDKLRLFIHTGGRAMLLCNFNVNNLFVRYKFGHTGKDDAV